MCIFFWQNSEFLEGGVDSRGACDRDKRGEGEKRGGKRGGGWVGWKMDWFGGFENILRDFRILTCF